MQTFLEPIKNTIKQDVALTGTNCFGPLCSVGHPTAHAAGLPTRRQCWQCYRRRQSTPTDDSKQNNTGPLGEPLIVK